MSEPATTASGPWRALRLLASFVWRLAWAPLSLLLLSLALVAGVWALLHGEAFTEQVATHLPGVEVVGPRGALLGDFEADRIEVALPRGGRILLQQPRWQGLRLGVDRSAPWWLGVQADRLSARRIDVSWVANPQAPPSAPPTDLSLPISVTVARLQVAELHGLTGAQPLQNIDAELRVGAMRHAVRLHSLVWTDWRLSGTAGLGAINGLALEADLRAQGRRSSNQAKGAGEAVLAGAGEVLLRASGPLQDLGVKLDVRWQPERGTQQTLQADVGVRPFAPWPVPRGTLSVSGLDLAALWPGLPRSAIAGRIDFDDQNPRDLIARLALRNGLAGAWDQGRLPWLSAKGQLAIDRAVASQAQADAWRQVRADLSLSLPGRTQAQPAQLLIQGPLMGREPLVLALQELAPKALLGSLPDLSLSGELRWAPTSGQPNLLAGELGARLTGQIHELAGRASQERVNVSLRSRVSPQQWDVSALSLSAGPAQARIDEARLRWGLTPQQGGWAAQGRLLLERFDPRAWLPWPAGLTGQTSLSGQGQFDVDGRGAGALQAALSASSLAGVPLAGQLSWAAPAGAAMKLDAQATLGGNRVQLSGQGVRGSGLSQPTVQAARWQLSVQAPDVASLSPWAGLLGAERLRGEFSLQASGAWPLQSLHYAVKGRDLAATQAEQTLWQVAGLDGEGELNLSQADGRMQATGLVQGLKLPSAQVDRLVLAVQGSAASHSIRLDGEASFMRHGQPDAGNAVRLAAAAVGHWRSTASEQGWQAQVNEAALDWVQARGRPALLRIEPMALNWRANETETQWQASATRVQLMGLIGELTGLVWRTPVQGSGAEARREVSLLLPAFQVAPWLARWQPSEGWGGDLISVGHVKLLQRADQPWEVDMALLRQSGDLSFTEVDVQGGRPQRLGLRDARVSLKAAQGVWVAEQHIEGRAMGLLRGRQVVQPLRAQDWPDAQSPLAGDLTLDVANLRSLGTWAPAGWRLGGQLQVQASLGGTVGSPQFTGRAEGSGLSATQALLGVHVQDGQLSVALDGDRVSLTRLQASDGPQGGQLSLTGELLLGQTLAGQVSIKAERFAALQRIDRRVVISGQADATLSDWHAAIKGQFGVDEGLIDISRSSAPTLGDDVSVVNRPGEEAPPDAQAGAASVPGKALTLDADVLVKLGERLRLRGHGVSGLLMGQVRITTPRNKPAIHGAIRLEQGKFAAYGQKLDIERSTITFNGLIENPRLDILAMRQQSPSAQDSDVKVGVRVTGTAQDPRIRLYSEPALSETEQLSWLVLGRGPTGLGGADIGLLQSAAVALLSGDDGPGLTDQVIGLLGLDNLSVSQSDGAVRETVVSVGKQIARHWYMGYERNLSATGGNWQLIYSLAQRFKVRAQAGEDNAIDFIWQWRWR